MATMNNKTFITGDLQTGDFLDYEIELINKALKRILNQEFLNQTYTDYDEIDQFYNDILND